MSFFFFSLFFCFEVEVKKKKKTQKHSHLGIRKKKLLGLLGVAAVHLIHPPLAPALLVPPVGQRQDQPEAVFGRRGHDQVEAREAVVGKDAEPGLEGAGHLGGLVAVLAVAVGEGEDAHGAARARWFEREKERKGGGGEFLIFLAKGKKSQGKKRKKKTFLTRRRGRRAPSSPSPPGRPSTSLCGFGFDCFCFACERNCGVRMRKRESF